VSLQQVYKSLWRVVVVLARWAKWRYLWLPLRFGHSRSIRVGGRKITRGRGPDLRKQRVYFGKPPSDDVW
jgi:hypothetical protein